MTRLTALLGALLLILLSATAHAQSRKAAEQSTRITFLHFNDTYRVWPHHGVGGMANMATLLRYERARAGDAITTHGGDFLSPSVYSSVTKGAHMVELMNRMAVDVAVVGNHELDFGRAVLDDRLGEMRFALLGANLTDRAGKGIPGVKAFWLRDVRGVKVGVFGLITPETRLYISGNVDVRFGDPIAAARKAVAALKALGAQVIVALTHMDLREDIALARAVPAVNLILGGHEHNAIVFVAGRTPIVKAGDDARYLAVVDLTLLKRGKRTVIMPTWRFEANVNIKPDAMILPISRKWEARLKKALGGPIATTTTEMDSTSATVRSREAAIGNLIADAIRKATNADVALQNGGGIRGNRRYRAGSRLTSRHVLTELPFNNVVMVLEITGRQLKAALEHGLARVGWGRFPHVSGVRVTWDSQKPAGQRIISLTRNGKPVGLDDRLTLATNDFLANGGDGYVMLKSLKRRIGANAGPGLAETVIAYLKAQKSVSAKVDGRLKDVGAGKR